MRSYLTLWKATHVARKKTQLKKTQMKKNSIRKAQASMRSALTTGPCGSRPGASPEALGRERPCGRRRLQPARVEQTVPPVPPAAGLPAVPDVAPPVPDDQALVVLLAQLGMEFGDRAARSSLTRVRTLRQRHHLRVEEVARHLDDAARLTRACRTVQPDTRMAYLLTVLENSVATPPPAVGPPGMSSEQRRWGRPAPPACSDGQEISRYIGGSYGVCTHCLSSPCEADCPTHTHEAAGPATPMVPGAVHPPTIARDSYATS